LANHSEQEIDRVERGHHKHEGLSELIEGLKDSLDLLEFAKKVGQSEYTE